MSAFKLVFTHQIAQDIEEAISYTFDNFGETTALKLLGAMRQFRICWQTIPI
jgi:hypothetical protein